MMRMCDICGQVDDHPRHIHAAAPSEATTPADIAIKAMSNYRDALAERIPGMTPEELADGEDAAEEALSILAHIRDSSTRMAHMDCCAATGCPDGSCVEISATIPGVVIDQEQFDPKGKMPKGDKLRAHLTSGKVDHIGHRLNQARQPTVLVEEQS